ncbi:MAG: aminotransferase class V-fold PLP-dependent enzyme [Pseudolabrys sp.]
MGEPSDQTAKNETQAMEPPAAIYLDYQATTPADPRVVEAMLPYFTRAFGNPHSRQHAHGWAAEDAVEAARRQVAALIGAPARGVIFTSGATEANNLAIKGAARRDPRRIEIVTVSTEHKCVLEACRSLEREGFRITVLPVRDSGLVDLDQLAGALSARTALVSVMAVNNEIGVIQPVAEIGRLARDHGALFHTDAAQAAGKIALDVEAMNIDLMSISGHKLYAPMGIGALYVRRQPGPRLRPLFDGGGQERGLRSGTLPLPLCVGFGVACDIARDEIEEESVRLAALCDRLLDALRARLPDIRVNGDMMQRVAGNLNVAFPGIDAEDLMMEVKGVAVSSGSACTSAEVEPSYVLRALGLPDDLARASLRISLGRFTTEDEIDQAAALLAGGAERLREG